MSGTQRDTDSEEKLSDQGPSPAKKLRHKFRFKTEGEVGIPSVPTGLVTDQKPAGPAGAGLARAATQVATHHMMKSAERSVVTILGRRVKMMEGHVEDGILRKEDVPVYSMLRQWVYDDPNYALPTTRTVMTSDMDKTMNEHQQPHQKKKKKRTLHTLSTATVDIKIPNIDDSVTLPTIETHLPRWKALGKKRRDEFQHMVAVGFGRLRETRMPSDDKV